jgi:carboxyl-terminal processing protease
MARYLRMLIHEGLGDRGRVLAPSAFREMLVQQYPDSKFDEYGANIYGLGFKLRIPSLDYAGSSISHAGATMVFHSQLTVLKDQGLGVFVSANTLGSDDLVNSASEEILQIALEQLRGLAPPTTSQTSPVTVISMSRAELESHAGLYAPGLGGYDKIVATDQGLEWTAGAGGANPATDLLLPRANGRFAPAAGGPVELEFQTISNRSVLIANLTEAGWINRFISGEKISPAPLSPAWQHRVGDYVWVNLPTNDYNLSIWGQDLIGKVRLEIRDGVLLLGSDVIVPASDTLAFTAGISAELGRGHGDAIRVETSGGIETLWFRGQAARLASLPLAGYTYPDAANLSTLTWTAAFEALHAKFSHEYAFGGWKNVDWDGLYSRFMPRIVQAQAAGDETAYYLALHEYICSIPDGHVSLGAANSALPLALAKALAGGGFGMAVAELDDGRVIAAAVIPGGPAVAAGIAAGDEIVTWGGQPIKTAIGQIDVGAIPYKRLTGAAGNETPLATLEYYRLEQTRLLTRGPVGSDIQVRFKSTASGLFRTVTLKANDDAGQTFSLLNFAQRPALSDQIDYRILPGGYGYILVRMEKDLSADGYPTRLFQVFQQAIASFVAAGVPGVIIDLRGNYGGSDDLAADMSGFFYSAPSFYESQAYYDKRNGQFTPITVGEHPPFVVANISINPQTPHFGGPVVVLVNPATTSSGEGPAMAISRLPNGRVIGFHGTDGSFGMTGGEITMPGGYTIEYPYGRSLDQNGVIQMDSKNGIGGVAPNPRVPMTQENVLAFAAGTDVELQYAIDYLSSRH